MKSYHPLQDPGDLPQTAFSFREIAAPVSHSLDSDVRADMVVVGAGITGLSAALHAASAGASVVVLEANEIAWGASGRNFGQVVPYLRHEPDHTIAVLGPENGRRMVEAARGGAELVFSLIDQHRIECEARRGGLVFAAHTPQALDKLKRRHAFWQGMGQAPELLDDRRVADLIGGGTYWGGLLEHRGGTINALSYTRGLAHAAIAAGVTVHCRSRVTGLKRERNGWVATAAGGSVTGETVMLCTNAYTDGLCRSLARTIVPLRAYQLLSRPISENLRASILPKANALTDTRRLMSGIRRHSDGRLHASGPVSPFGPEQKPDIGSVTRRLLKCFPQLGSLEWEKSWSGWVAMIPGEYPRMIDIAPGVIAGVGYSGRGLALATIMGRELARRTGGAKPDDLAFSPSAPRALPFPTIIRVLVKGLSETYRLRDRIDEVRFGKGPPKLGQGS